MTESRVVAQSVFQLLLAEALSSVEASVSEESTEAQTQAVETKIEELGHGVGYRFMERSAQTGMLSAEPLEVIKTALCIQFWTEVFGKKIDKLQTNHRGVFVLKDNDFKWLARYSASDEVVSLAGQRLLKFPCGLIRGALENLGIHSTVSAEIESEVKAERRAVKFHISLSSIG